MALRVKVLFFLMALEARKGSMYCSSWNADVSVPIDLEGPSGESDDDAPHFLDSDHGAVLGGGVATPISPAVAPTSN